MQNTSKDDVIEVYAPSTEKGKNKSRLVIGLVVGMVFGGIGGGLIGAAVTGRGTQFLVIAAGVILVESILFIFSIAKQV
jgi:hypothetical protein